MSSGESATRVSERVTGPVLVAGVMKHDVEIRNSTRPFSSAFRIPGRRLEEGPALVPAKTPQVDMRFSCVDLRTQSWWASDASTHVCRRLGPGPEAASRHTGVSPHRGPACLATIPLVRRRDSHSP